MKDLKQHTRCHSKGGYSGQPKAEAQPEIPLQAGSQPAGVLYGQARDNALQAKYGSQTATEHTESIRKLQQAGRILERTAQAYRKRKDRTAQPYLSVSVQLSQSIYRSRLIPAFQAYLALKFHHRDGKAPASTALETIRQTLGHRDSRQARKGLQKCLELGWIHKGHAHYYVRAFGRLEAKFNTTRRTAGVLRLSDIQNFREWTAGHFMASRYRTFSRVRKSRRTSQGRKLDGRECPVSIIAEELNISRSTAHYLKHRAMKQGYLKAKGRTERLNIQPRYAGTASRLLDDQAIFVLAGQVFRRLADWLTFNLDDTTSRLRLIHFRKRPKNQILANVA